MNKTVGVIRHIGVEGLGSIEEVLKQTNTPYVYIDTWKDRLPADVSGYGAFVILGGPMGVYESDKYPFIENEIDLVKKARSTGLPVIGICLGSQIIAQSLGGRVYKGGKKEVGWYNITFSDEIRNDPVFSPLSDKQNKSLRVFQWHGDTFDLPDGASLLASSALYKNQAFRIDKNIYGLQFHIEVKESDINAWIKEYKSEVESLKPSFDIKTTLADTRIYIDNLNRISAQVFKRFFSLI